MESGCGAAHWDKAEIKKKRLSAGNDIEKGKNSREEILLDADDIVFGEKLGVITQEVPVSESERRYGIETQSDDLLNDLLSTVPTASRTPKVLKSIHTMVERYQWIISLCIFDRKFRWCYY